MSEIGLGGMNAAAIAIEQARGTSMRPSGHSARA